MTRVAVYARVSTRDKGQDPEVQLAQLREYVRARDWALVGEYVDLAAAGDRRRREQWRALLEQADRRHVDLILVTRLDRAFRSTLDALEVLQTLEHRGVGFACVAQPELDTTSPAGRLLFTVAAAFAELERSIIRERVTAGMAHAKARGKHVGRPLATDRRSLREKWPGVALLLAARQITKTEAARRLQISPRTLKRILDQGGDV